jgi:formate hydrogenlyase transcriptional activator
MLSVFYKSLIHSYLKKICLDPFRYDYSYQLQFIIDHSTTHRSVPAQMSVDAMLPPDEPERVAALQRYEILDTPPDEAFNHLTAVAAALFRVPIAVVSLVDRDRIWFKSHYGLEVCETGREPGLCASAIFSPDVYHIRDALTDARALANPLVTKEVGLRFYAAAPLRTHDGFNLGTLCIMDRKARKLSVLEAGMLTKLAALVMDQMELRLAARKVAELEQLERSMREEHEGLGKSEEHLRDLFDEAPIAYVEERLDTRLIRANRAAMRILGIKPEEIAETLGKSLVPDTVGAQSRLREVLTSIEGGTEASDAVLELRRKDNGNPIWVQFWSKPAPEGKYTRSMFVDITERVLLEQEKARLEAQNIYLQEEIRSEHNFDEIVGNSPSLLEVLRQGEQIAKTDCTVLILGETGTGKELIARFIHDRSQRENRALVKLNCGAIFAGLVESELFGHVKGAFTGAIANREGRFKLADGGTIFLDEVGELPQETQVKLLRVLQEQEFEPIGSSKTIKVNVRVLAATNRNLQELVREGNFRADLFYRLNVVPLRVPGLRERASDIPLLAKFFVQKFAKKFGKQIKSINDEAMRCLTNYSWPGNIRELQNVIERAVILSPGKTLILAEELHAVRKGVHAHATAASGEPIVTTLEGPYEGSLDAVERRHIESVLKETDWLIEGEHGAARILNMNPSTLRSRLKKLNISRPKKLRG